VAASLILVLSVAGWALHIANTTRPPGRRGPREDPERSCRQRDRW